MEATNNKQVRINLSESAKGLWQIDVTAEFDTAEESGKALDAAIDQSRAVMKAKGLKEAGE